MHLRPYLLGLSLVSVLALSACGGGSAPQADIGGTVTGLAAGASLTLSEGPTAATLSVSGNGGFDFSQRLAANAPYGVVVQQQPNGQTCSVSNGSGTVDANADAVSDIQVTCTNNASIGGQINGLAAGQSVTLSDGLGTQTLSAAGTFGFAETFAPGQPYQVSVSAQPAGQTCLVTANGSGAIDAMADNVSNVDVDCFAVGTLHGTVSGLADGAVVTLSDGISTVDVSQSGGFTFPDVLAAGAAYAITVVNPPAGQTCVVTPASGTVDAAGDAIAGIAVSCS
jgi:hypothetical protein